MQYKESLSEMMQLGHSREAGWLEKYYIVRNTYGFYSNFNITVKLNEPVSASLLSSALHELLQNNLWYTYNFFTETTDNSYHNGDDYIVKYVNKIEFDDVVSFENVDKFDASLLSQVNNISLPMNCASHPLWKLIVYQEPDGGQYICAVFDHSIFDGGSGLIFQQELVRELSTAKDVEKKILFQYDPSLPAISCSRQSVTNLYKPTAVQLVSFYFNKYVAKYLPKFALELWRNITSRFSSGVKINFAANPIFCNPNHDWRSNRLKTCITNVNFTPEQTKQILTYCRSQGITMTPFFNVVMLQSLQETLFKHPDIQFSTTSFIAFQGRRYYPEVAPELKSGVWISAQGITLPPITNPLESMKYVYQEMQKNLVSRKSFGEFGLLGLHNYREFFDSSFTQVTKSLTVSNLGRVEQVEDKYKIVDAYFGSSVGTNYNVVLNMISTAEGGLNATVGYFPEFDKMYIDDKRATDVCWDKFKQTILSTIG